MFDANISKFLSNCGFCVGTLFLLTPCTRMTKSTVHISLLIGVGSGHILGDAEAHPLERMA